MIIQDPENWTNIVVTGVNVKSMQTDLNQLNTDFPEFMISYNEQDQPLFSKQFVSDLPAEVEIRKAGSIIKSDSGRESYATIELLVAAQDLSKVSPHAKNAVYAVVAAHLILDSNLRQRYIDDSSRFALSYRPDVEAQTTKTSFVIRTKDKKKVFDLQHPPLLSYRYYFTTTWEQSSENQQDVNPLQGMAVTMCPELECRDEIKDGECHHSYLNDIALIRVGHHEAKDLWKCLKAAHVERRQVNEIKRIKSRKHLDLLCKKKKRIAIGEATGHLIRFPKQFVQPSSEKTENMFAVHLPFILTSKDADGRSQ